MKKEVELKLLKLSPNLFKENGQERYEEILSKEKESHFYRLNNEDIMVPFLVATESVFEGEEHLNENQIETYNGSKGRLLDKIIAYPHQIGMKYLIEYDVIQNGELKPIEKWEIDEIIDLGGVCNIEMMDEFSHPYLYHHVGLFEGLPEPYMVKGKVIILN